MKYALPTAEEDAAYYKTHLQATSKELERVLMELKHLTEYVDRLNVPEDKTYTIYIDIKGGVLQGIYGNQLPIGCQIDFVLRDWDSINEYQPDPYRKSSESDVHYW